MGYSSQPQHDDRYAMAEQYIQVMYKLFESSWRDDAVKLDRQTGVYSDPSLVRQINHKGKFFDVPGPHLCSPSPQRTPLLLQAGTSSKGKVFAAQHAEAIFVSHRSPDACKANIAGVRRLAKEEFGRYPQNLKVLALVTPILGRTEEEAQAKYADYKQYADLEGALALFGGWTGIDLNQYEEDEELTYVESNAVRAAVESYARFSPGVGKWTRQTIAEHVSIGGNGPVLVGTPGQVADVLFEDVVELLVPELRKGGLFWKDHAVPDGAYRENFYGRQGQTGPLEEHVASRYRWSTGARAEEHNIPA
ncbi:alkanesulfonate monooxygenase [Cladophialophora yegresii CBS 114405]|uniref:Alkanesulfonate monooxygenase n=1 Tax=Cladophialophora yegresii CBS 114405 TaxID=1182544 RepID=W9VNR2_9EURO|nr:alkanesulfonate monooxygenase [Cladophialophora yegresii CBS 114405]EXJ54650.1 alkanesulfonate monooxygenase [Cladophialophora yegresii CBS 114405]